MIIPQTRANYPQVADCIDDGGVIAFRTDTFYGLGADPFNPKAIERIKELKGREEGKPILIVISDPEHAERFIAERSPAFNTISAKFWPGPLTLIATARDEVPAEITAGTGTVGIRLPADEEVRDLVRIAGGALTATSTNPSGREPARTAAEVKEYFGTAIDLIVDGGESRLDQPSTVVDTTGNSIKLVREGAIPWREILECGDLPPL